MSRSPVTANADIVEQLRKLAVDPHGKGWSADRLMLEAADTIEFLRRVDDRTQFEKDDQ